MTACPECEDDAEAVNLPERHVAWKWLAQTTENVQHLPSDQISPMSSAGDHVGIWM